MNSVGVWVDGLHISSSVIGQHNFSLGQRFLNASRPNSKRAVNKSTNVYLDSREAKITKHTKCSNGDMSCTVMYSSFVQLFH